MSDMFFFLKCKTKNVRLIFSSFVLNDVVIISIAFYVFLEISTILYLFLAVAVILVL